MFVSLLAAILIVSLANLHHGVVIPDTFMELIENAPLSKADLMIAGILWILILDT